MVSGEWNIVSTRLTVLQGYDVAGFQVVFVYSQAHLSRRIITAT